MNVTTAQMAVKGEIETMSNVTFQTDAPVVATQPTQPDSKPKKSAKAAPRRKATKAPKKAKKASVKTAKKTTHQPAGEHKSKKAEVMAMMRRPRGATLGEIVSAMAWQKHTVRGFISILGKKGEAKIKSSKNSAGERVYRIGK